jgi:hypothetical protein
MAVIDTHELVEDLVASGIKKKQAEAINNAVKQSSNHLVTVSDLELALVKQKVELLKWIVPMFLTNLLLIIGLWFYLS